MRIFCAVRHSNDPRQFYGGLWCSNFYPALRQLGHEIIESQVDLLPTSQFMSVAGNFTAEEQKVRESTTEQILTEVRESLRRGPVHLFLSYFYNSHFDPNGFDELRQLGVPSVNFYCNSIYQFENVSTIAAKVDYAWHPEKDARSLYLAVGAHPIWIQMAADPAVYHPILGKPRRPKAVFIGQRYADRPQWLASLVHAGLPVDIYGTGWAPTHEAQNKMSTERGIDYLGRRNVAPGSPRSYIRSIASELKQHGPIQGALRVLNRAQYRCANGRCLEILKRHVHGFAADVTGTMAEYEISLNFSNVWSDGQPGSQLIPHVRLRDFEGPMCRTCYLSGHSDELAEFYEIGSEIDTYRTPEELIEKTKFYLHHPKAAEKLREAGYRRASRDHTWKCRFEELLRKLRLVKAFSKL